jgi:hypothetical protein
VITAFIAFVKSLSWQTYLVVALGVAGVTIYAEKTGHIVLLEHELAGMTKERDGLKTERDAAVTLGKQTDAAWRAKEAQTTKDQKEASDEAQRLSIRARDDSSAASTALQRLLARASSSRQTPSNSQAPFASAPVEGGGLRTDLLGSVGDEAIRYAAIADAARIAGQACEQSYDALNPYGD